MVSGDVTSTDRPNRSRSCGRSSPSSGLPEPTSTKRASWRIDSPSRSTALRPDCATSSNRSTMWSSSKLTSSIYRYPRLARASRPGSKAFSPRVRARSISKAPVTRSSLTPRGRSMTGVGRSTSSVSLTLAQSGQWAGSAELTGHPRTTVIGGKRAAKARTAVDFPVPRSPNTRTPPMPGSIAVRIMARFICSWPTMAEKGKGVFMSSRLYIQVGKGALAVPGAVIAENPKAGIKLFAEPIALANRLDSMCMGAADARELGHAFAVGPNGKRDLVQEGHFADADLEGHIAIIAYDGTDIRHTSPETQGLQRPHGGARQRCKRPVGRAAFGRERGDARPLPSRRHRGEKNGPAFAGLGMIAPEDRGALGLCLRCPGIGPCRQNRIDCGVGDWGEAFTRAGPAKFPETDSRHTGQRQPRRAHHAKRPES